MTTVVEHAGQTSIEVLLDRRRQQGEERMCGPERVPEREVGVIAKVRLVHCSVESAIAAVEIREERRHLIGVIERGVELDLILLGSTFDSDLRQDDLPPSLDRAIARALEIEVGPL